MNQKGEGRNKKKQKEKSALSITKAKKINGNNKKYVIMF